VPITPAQFYNTRAVVPATCENASTLAASAQPKKDAPKSKPTVSPKTWNGPRYLDLVHAANDANVFGAMYKEKGSTWAKVGASLRAKGLDHSDQVFQKTIGHLLQYHDVSIYYASPSR
jgi:hypothetical protein